jgi:hypothetical protein
MRFSGLRSDEQRVVEDLRSELGQYSPYCHSKCTSNGGARGKGSKCQRPSMGWGERMGEDADLKRR